MFLSSTRHSSTLFSMYLSSTRHSSTFIIIWNVCCFFYFSFGIYFISKCLFLCVTRKCETFAVLAFLCVILICFTRRTIAGIISDAQLNRHRQRRPLKNGWIYTTSHVNNNNESAKGKKKQEVDDHIIEKHNLTFITFYHLFILHFYAFKQ